MLTKTAEGSAWETVPAELPDGGTQGQILTVGAEGAPEWDDAPDTGVTTFNGRTGAVTPQSGDYTAEMVGQGPVPGPHPRQMWAQCPPPEPSTASRFPLM